MMVVMVVVHVCHVMVYVCHVTPMHTVDECVCVSLASSVCCGGDGVVIMLDVMHVVLNINGQLVLTVVKLGV